MSKYINNENNNNGNRDYDINGNGNNIYLKFILSHPNNIPRIYHIRHTSACHTSYMLLSAPQYYDVHRTPSYTLQVNSHRLL